MPRRQSTQKPAMQKLGLPTAAAIALLVGATAAGAQSGSDTRRADERAPASQDAGQTPVSSQPASQQPPGQEQRDGAQRDDTQTPAAGRGDAASRIALSKEQQGTVSSVIRQSNLKPVGSLDFPLTAGTRVPDSVPIVPMPDEIVAVLPQFLNYSFFIDQQQELVILDPATRQIKALVPISGGAAVAERPRTDGERAGAGSRRSETQSVGTSARTETGRSTGSDSSRSPPRKRTAREVGRADDSDETTGDIPRRPPQTDRQRSAHNQAERRKTVHTDTDVTVGSAMPDAVEIERVRPMPPPARAYRRVERDEGEPVPAGPLGGIFGLFNNIFR